MLSAVTRLCLLSSAPITIATLETRVQRSPLAPVNQASFLNSWTMSQVREKWKRKRKSWLFAEENKQFDARQSQKLTHYMPVISSFLPPFHPSIYLFPFANTSVHLPVCAKGWKVTVFLWQLKKILLIPAIQFCGDLPQDSRTKVSERSSKDNSRKYSSNWGFYTTTMKH